MPGRLSSSAKTLVVQPFFRDLRSRQNTVGGRVGRRRSIDSGSSSVTGYRDIAKLAFAAKRELHRESIQEVLLTFA
jgi:hypothetical protein